jgi:hypothetical protein
MGAEYIATKTWHLPRFWIFYSVVGRFLKKRSNSKNSIFEQKVGFSTKIRFLSKNSIFEKKIPYFN